MADQPISGLATYPASPTSATGTSADEIEFLDVNDTSMAATGTNKRVNMADFFSTFITAGTNITVTKQTSGGGVSITAAGGAPGGTSGQIQYNNTTFGGFTMSGDATLVTSTGVITIASGAITLAKQANFAASSLMGNPTGSPASPSAITLGANLSFSGTTLVASGGSGTVTSVSWTGDGTIFTATECTAITTSGTLTPGTGGAGLIAQTKNTFLAGPTTGSNAAPTFRALGQADLTGASPISSPGTGASSEQFGSGASTGASANTNATAVGNSALAGAYGVAIGNTASNSAGQRGTSIGYGATCTYVGISDSVAIGYSATVSGQYAIAIGIGSSASYSTSIALGTLAATTSANQLVIGGSNFTINMTNIIGGTTGNTLNLTGTSSSTAGRACGIVASSFNTSIDASWSGNLLLYAGDYTSTNAGKCLGVQIQSNGSAALVGFFGATPVVQPPAGAASQTMTVGTGTPVLAGSTFVGSGTAAYTIDDIVKALKALGLLAP